MEKMLIVALFLVLVMIVLFWGAILYKTVCVFSSKKKIQIEAQKMSEYQEQQKKNKEERLLGVLQLDNSGYSIDKVVEIVKEYRGFVKG